MKKLFFTLAILFMLMPMAFAGNGAGIFAGVDLQVPESTTQAVPVGFEYGFEFGFIASKVEVWPSLSIEMTFAEKISYVHATLGVDVELFGWFAIQPGVTFALDQDYADPIIVGGLSFPQNEWGWGPSLEASAAILKLGKNDYLQLRPSVAASYVVMTQSDPEFRLRLQLTAHLRGTW